MFFNVYDKILRKCENECIFESYVGQRDNMTGMVIVFHAVNLGLILQLIGFLNTTKGDWYMTHNQNLVLITTRKVKEN